MKNIEVMKKVKELDLQTLTSREQSIRVMVQIAIIRKAFAVKNSETDESVTDYERKMVLSDNEIRKEFEQYLCFLKSSIERKDIDKTREFENQINYFVDGVNFFYESLANEFREIVSLQAI